MAFEICSCCGKPKRPKNVSHPLPGCPVRALDEQSGTVRSSHGGGTSRNKQEGGIQFRTTGNDYQSIQYGDDGGASRFFHRSAWELEYTDPFLYAPKASRAEREEGLRDGGIGALRDGGRYKKQILNDHPTIKPLALTQWLATLLLPPAEYAPRRLLVPFAGVASEMIGAWFVGWDEIVGVEMEREYVALGRARFDHYLAQGRQLLLFKNLQ